MLKVALSGYLGFKNFGDEAILSVLVNHLKTLGAEITAFSGNPKFTSETYNITSVNRFDLKNIVKVINNSDILISGGGSLLQDVTSLKSLIYYAFIIALGILFNKKVIIFAQGIGPINNKFAHIIVKNLLRFCALVTVRDEKSFNLLNSWGINADLVCDPIYSLKVDCNKSEGVVGIQLRDFKTMNYNLLQKLALLVVTRYSDKKIEIFSLQHIQDYELCAKFQQLLLSFNPDLKTEIVYENIINRISKLEYLFAMRFHAILVALKCGIKTCAINYDIKVQNLAKEFGLPIISMNAEENMEVICQNLENLNSNIIMKQAKSKTFDWTKFDELFVRFAK